MAIQGVEGLEGFARFADVWGGIGQHAVHIKNGP